MQLSLYSKITTLTSVHSRAGCYLSLSDILVFFLPTQKSRTLTQPVALLFQMHSQGWAGGHTPHMQQWDSHHWMSSEGTWGQGCSRPVLSYGIWLWFVCHTRWEMIQLYVRLGVFISYHSFFWCWGWNACLQREFFLPLGWSSGSPYIARKEIGTFRMLVAIWLKYLIFSVILYFIT